MNPDYSYHCLLVDDSRSALRLLKGVLAKLTSGTLVTVENGAQALEKIQSENFQVAFIDIMMPEMDGFTLAEKIKGLKPDIHVVMWSALDTVETKEKMKSLQIPFFLPKPIESSEITGLFQVMDTLDFFQES